MSFKNSELCARLCIRESVNAHDAKYGVRWTGKGVSFRKHFIYDSKGRKFEETRRTGAGIKSFRHHGL